MPAGDAEHDAVEIARRVEHVDGGDLAARRQPAARHGELGEGDRRGRVVDCGRVERGVGHGVDAACIGLKVKSVRSTLTCVLPGSNG